MKDNMQNEECSKINGFSHICHGFESRMLHFLFTFYNPLISRIPGSKRVFSFHIIQYFEYNSIFYT